MGCCTRAEGNAKNGEPRKNTSVPRKDALLHYGFLRLHPSHAMTPATRGPVFHAAFARSTRRPGTAIAKLGGTLLWELSKPDGFNLADGRKALKQKKVLTHAQTKGYGVLYCLEKNLP